MAKQRYYLDSRVFTAFFIAAMPFVAFGSFVVVNVARNQLRESVGANLEQRAVQTKLGLEQYLAGEVVHLRLLALSPDVQQALAGTPRALPPAEEAAKLEQDWAAGRDPKLVASVVEAKASSALRALGTVHPVVRQLQVVDALGSCRRGRGPQRQALLRRERLVPGRRRPGRGRPPVRRRHGAPEGVAADAARGRLPGARRGRRRRSARCAR